ncbi:MAG: HAD family phosphatase [Ruminococcus sp.]|nr:HAD family phosphatase [Ruminococcus sp.]
MKPKIIITDLDGTLLRSDGSISAHTKNVLTGCKEQGIHIVIATARYWIGAERYIDELQPDYEITTDGTLIHTHGKEIYSCTLSTEQTNRIIHDILALGANSEITVASGRTVFWNSKHISGSEKLHKAVYCDYSTPLNCRANKIVAMLPDAESASLIADNNHCRLQRYRGENWYGFLPKEAGKVQAIRELASRLNIPLSLTAAFGDDRNDTDMLKICGKGIAVANAIPELKDIADEITSSNDNDGVAEWIERYCL